MPECINIINSIKKYNKTRYFHSTRNGSDILFAVQTDIKPILQYNENYDYDIESRIYLFSYAVPGRCGVHIDPSRSVECWDLKTDHIIETHRASFKCSLFLPGYLHGFGVGSVVMNQLIEIGKELFPDAEISLRLEPGQAVDIENRERRHRFYQRFNFNLEYEMEPRIKGRGWINRVDELKTKSINEIGGIEEIHVGDAFYESISKIEQLEMSLGFAHSANKAQSRTIQDYEDLVTSLTRFKYGVYAAGIAIVFVILGYIRSQIV